MLSPILDAACDPDLKGLSPDRIARALHVPLADIARLADVHRNTLTRTPTSPRSRPGLAR
jgi:hypothetical protein